MTSLRKILAACIVVSLFFQLLPAQIVTGELRVWHPITLTFDGPATDEQATPNPFSDYRLIVTFSKDSTHYEIPGYFAADGSAAESGAIAGDKWRVVFVPDRPGQWNYLVSFLQGEDIAISDDHEGQALSPDGMTGIIDVEATDKSGQDFRGKGFLEYVNKRYLRHAGIAEYFIKSGADSPETLLAYQDFDQTYLLSSGAPLKSWSPHAKDWSAGDPVWRDSLGRGLIGAVNYLASERQNVISFLTMNIEGDGDNVWPFADPDQLDRFDCSKLDQWDIVFRHCDRKGIALHVKTQEEENDQLLDMGELGRARILYYRELIARFGYHLGVFWDLGEENSNTNVQRIAFAEYFHAHDPYHHPIVIHTYRESGPATYAELFGNNSEINSVAMQADEENVHAFSLNWVNAFANSDNPWVVSNDEQGIAFVGVPHDGFAGLPSQDNIRTDVLWGNLMAGGAGVEYYFGYALPENDLNCEDFRSRDRMWDYNRAAVSFFKDYLPFWDMHSADSLVVVSAGVGYCFVSDTIVTIYASVANAIQIDLRTSPGTFSVRWYDPRDGGALLSGGVSFVSGGNIVNPGSPPYGPGKDWVVLLKRTEEVPVLDVLSCIPASCTTSTLTWESGQLEFANVEYSMNGQQFVPLTSANLQCTTDRCFIRVPGFGEYTYYRVRFASGYSNIARGHLPCFMEVPRPQTEARAIDSD